MSRVKRLHAIITARLIFLLASYVYAHDLGEISTEGGYQLDDTPDSVRAPDVAFVTKARITPIVEGYEPNPPDLAIEVISPSNTADEMNEKIAEYFAAGVQQVWLVYPTTRTIQIYTSLKQIIGLDVTDTLESDTLLPGFSVPVRDIFAVLPDASAPTPPASAKS